MRSIILTFRLLLLLIIPATGFSQSLPLQPGEAFLTRFSGAKGDNGLTAIDPNGTVGSIIDLRRPGQPPEGHHWIDEPQRQPVTASQVGQVFGIAFDDADPPNIYLTATSAYGLHHLPDNSAWMDGMWGPGGGPGTVWKLSADNNYHPEIFADVTLDERPNTGVSLGNIAFDRWNKQFYVSDLETGMIHRLQLEDGIDLGRYDHGVDGRSWFFDAKNRRMLSLPKVYFDPNSGARIDDCPNDRFDKTPNCWNFADFRRRVWGVAVRRDQTTGEVRLYYSVWSSKGFGNPDRRNSDYQEQRNSVWSVRIKDDGRFDKTSVRREFFLPDFFHTSSDLEQIGPSHPISDIAIPSCSSQQTILVAERGGINNPDLGGNSAITRQQESRVLSFKLGLNGIWRVSGRYDVGFAERKSDDPPIVRANSAGGVTFGFDYDNATWELNPAKADEFAWMTGDALCSPEGPCFDPLSNQETNDTQVHGLQGMSRRPYDKLSPHMLSPPDTPGRAYLIDSDVNLNQEGMPLLSSLQRNDAGRTGDVEIYSPCNATAIIRRDMEKALPAPPDPPDHEEISIPTPAKPASRLFDLKISKRLNDTDCRKGGNCGFITTITNKGPDTFSGPLLVHDTLPKGSSAIAGEKPWNCKPSAGDLHCRHAPLTLKSGASTTLKVSFTPSEKTPPPKQMSSCATLNWTKKAPGGNAITGDANPDNDKSCANLPQLQSVSPSPAKREFDLELENLGPDTCTIGDRCTFQVRISNRGTTPYKGRLHLKAVPSGATLLNIEPTPPWICLVKSSFLCIRHGLSLAPGASETLTLSLQASSSRSNSVNSVKNCARIDWALMGRRDENGENDQDCTIAKLVTEKPIRRKADLELTQKGPSSCDAGSICKGFEVRVTNRGTEPHVGPITLYNRLPEGWALIQAGGNELTCGGQSGQAFECGSTGIKLPSGGSMVININAKTPDTKNGRPLKTRFCTKIIQAPGSFDKNKANDKSCIALQLKRKQPVKTPVVKQTTGQPDLLIRKHPRGKCDPGNPCSFMIEVAGRGTVPYTLPFEIVDILPKGWSFNGGNNDQGWDCRDKTKEGRRVCRYAVTPMNDLKAGGNKLRIDLHTRVAYSQPVGKVKNCTMLKFSPGSQDANSNNNTGCTSVEIVHYPRLNVEMKANRKNCAEGSKNCGFTVTIRNLGKGDYDGLFALENRFIPGTEIMAQRISGTIHDIWKCRTGDVSGYADCHRSKPLKAGRQAVPKINAQIPLQPEA